MNKPARIEIAMKRAGMLCIALCVVVSSSARADERRAVGRRVASSSRPIPVIKMAAAYRHNCAESTVSPSAESFTSCESIRIADQLMTQLGIDSGERRDVQDRLEGWLATRRFSAPAAFPISGIFAFQMGGGGLILKVTKGKGLVRYHDAPDELPLQLKSVTVGAQLGGASEFGIGLILGAAHSFGGKYRVTEVSATAGGAGANTTELTKRYADPAAPARVVLLSTAIGLAANAGGGELTITVGR